MERVLEPEVMEVPEEAHAYAAMDHREANDAFLARLLELGASGHMLDIGTGPGDIPVAVCQRLPRAVVLGIDLSPAMLTLARRRLADRPEARRIELRRGDASQLEFPDASFDTVFSNTILHHLPDPVAFLREAARVRRPRGTLLIRDLFRPNSPERARELVALHAPGATPEQQELFRASLCAALEPAELRDLANEAGLECAELVIDSDRHMSLQLRAGSP